MFSPFFPYNLLFFFLSWTTWYTVRFSIVFIGNCNHGLGALERIC